ncbi:TPA: hypothetical protein ACMFP1_002887 [Pseudomonas aeruginosa]
MSAPIVIHHPVHSSHPNGGAEQVTHIYEPLDLSDKGAIEHFAATYNRALRHAQGEGVHSVDIYLGERTQPRIIDGEIMIQGGWLEHTIVVRYTEGKSFTIGAIQRKPTDASEFHS